MNIHTDTAGQSLVEFALALLMLCVLVFGIIDFSRAVYDLEVMKNLAGEGSAMASRGTSPANTATTVVNFAGSDLGMKTKGCVIVTAVTNTGAAKNPLQVSGQGSQCAIVASSKVGCLKGQGSCGTSNATLPNEASLALQTNQTLYVTEVFYTFSAITPIQGILNLSGQALSLPSQLYSAAYY